MATQTSKGLIKPTDADLQDVAVLNANSDRINDYAMGAFVCTSTTRPTGSNLWNGMIIKETDTSAIGVWDAAAGAWSMIDTIWQTFTPTVYIGATALTVAQIGNGVLAGKYFRVGKQIRVQCSFVLGSTTAFGGAVGSACIGHPFPAALLTPSGFSASLLGQVGSGQTLGAGNIVHNFAVEMADNANTPLYVISTSGPPGGGAGNVNNFNTVVGQGMIGAAGLGFSLSYTYQAA